MVLRRLIVPVAIVVGLLTVPASAQAADPIPVTVRVTGAQTYGGQPAFAGSTGVAGLTVTGVTCTGLTSGVAISPTLKALVSYTIAGATCSGGTLSQPGYTIAGYTGAGHTVYRAPLKVTAENRAKVFGDPNPSLGYGITGYVNGQDSSVVTGAPTLSTTATTSSDAGSYPISVAAGTLAVPSNNYYLTYAAGTLTVSPKPVAVTVSGVQNYGDQPVFSAKTSVTGVTVSDVVCTGVLTGQPIAPTLPAGSYAIDPATCSNGVLSSTNHVIGSYKSASFLVFKAALTVSASDQTRTYGAANPALGYTITGFQNGDDASVVTGEPALATTATTTSDVGSYPITPTAGTLASSNYRFVYVPGTLSVTPKPVAVTVNGAQNYGEQPAFSGKTGVSGLTVSGVSCAGVLGGETIAPTLPAGSYAVDPATCGGGVLSSTNYVIESYRSASFLVFKATVTVTATDASRVYGFANPTLAYTLTGLQNGEDASDLGGAPTLSTPAVVKSDVGTYPIEVTVGSLSSANYRFVLRPGTLTVTKRQLTVTADPATRGYGAEPPAYTATYTGFRNGDSAAVLTGAPAFSTPATATSDPGTYPLHVAQGTLDSRNYSFGGFVSSTLTITTGVADIATTKLSAGVVSATITFGANRTPVVGSTITFTVGNGDNPACTAVTDATGRAACTVSGSTKLAIQLNGYTAHFPGTAALLPGKKHQGIL